VGKNEFSTQPVTGRKFSYFKILTLKIINTFY
jgi:hypothetical protein